ncbi:fibrobacter succinogenes major paralogous domain-containing protein, partial [bacterium]|nr:fibrobacter succinogenes major paralogous domain-containing protein [bacterium]
VAGGKMKETGTEHWNSPNTGATNGSGFSALPGGYRRNYGAYYYMGYSATFWSSTGSNSVYAWNTGLSYSGSEVSRYGSSKQVGLSVRCVRD